MPVALDPSETHEYVICTDRAKTVGGSLLLLEDAPTLVFHFPTGREQRLIARLFEKSTTAADVDESIELRCDAVRLILVGWKNFIDRNGDPVPYDPQNLDAVLSDTDLTELNARLLSEMSLAEMDKKKFALSALSSSRGSAPNAAPVANAGRQTTSSPSSSNASSATGGSGAAKGPNANRAAEAGSTD